MISYIKHPWYRGLKPLISAWFLTFDQPPISSPPTGVLGSSFGRVFKHLLKGLFWCWFRYWLILRSATIRLRSNTVFESNAYWWHISHLKGSDLIAPTTFDFTMLDRSLWVSLNALKSAFAFRHKKLSFRISDCSNMHCAKRHFKLISN